MVIMEGKCSRERIKRTMAGFPVHDYARLTDAQTKLGWEQMKYGRWSYQWDYMQQRFLRQMGYEKDNEPK